MALVSIPVPSLIQGVSQQPEALRLPSQGELQENAFSSVVDGLVKRHPTQHVAKIINGSAGDAKIHPINRDSAERYLVVLRAGDVKVFDTAGVSIPVKGPTAPLYTPDFSYLSGAPENYRALTVADYTFVANRTKTVLMDAATTAADTSAAHAFVFVRAGEYDTPYNITLKKSGGSAQTFRVHTWTGTNYNGDPTEFNTDMWVLNITSPGTVGQQWTVTVGTAGATASHGTYSVTVAVGDTAATIAGKLRIAMSAGANVECYGSEQKVKIEIGMLTEAALVTVTATATNGTYESFPVLESIDTEAIAEWFRREIDAHADWTATRTGAVVRVTGATAIDTMEATSGATDALVAINHSVKQPTDLPLVCQDGYKVRVRGETAENEDDYILKFVANTAASFGDGYWQESIDYSQPYKYNATTMPHQLVRKTDDLAGTVTGTPSQKYFEWGPVAWTDKAIGDSTLVPNLSFVGDTIRDIFFFKNRLGVLSGENVILSEAGRYFNFWRTTLVAVVDSDPIDSAAAHTSVAVLNSAIPFDERLLLFSDRTQFVLTGEPTLTPKSVSIVPVLEFENFALPRPVPSGRGVFFAYKRGSYSGVREIVPLDSRAAFDTDDLTSPVPKYILGEVAELTATTLEDVLCVLAKGDRTTLYIYKFYWAGQQKVQSAWSTYTFGSGSGVQGVAFIENVLYLVIQRAQGLFLEKMEIGSGLVDTNAGYLTYLDRRITNAQATAIVYDGVNNKTTFTLPYDIAAGATMQVVTRCTAPNNGGANLTVLATDTAVSGSHKLTVFGDHRTTALWIGEKYTKKFRFSEPTLRASSGNGSRIVASGRLQIRRGLLVYDRSSYFKVLVSPRYRDTYTHEFSGQVLGSQQYVLGELPIESGEFSFGVMSKADQVTVEVQNDSPLPSNLLSLEWEATYTSRSTRTQG